MEPIVEVKSVYQLISNGYDVDRLVNDFVNVNKEVWGGLAQDDVIWDEKSVISQFSICPKLQYCAIFENSVVGTVSTIYINYDDALACSSWEQLSAKRMFTTHNKNGDSSFGLDLSVLPKFQTKGISTSLIEQTFYETVVLEGKKGVFLGSRIPSFHKYYKTRDVDTHVFGKNRNGKTMDPEIRLYQREGFEAIKVVPNYIEDPKSMNFGVLMFLENSELE
jgi:GNAT superfamily N-acetyltransferase